MIATVLGLIITAVCWGLTNTLIHYGTQGLTDVSEAHAHSHWLTRMSAEYYFLFTRWQVSLQLTLHSLYLQILSTSEEIMNQIKSTK
jgi:hypothetical protein